MAKNLRALAWAMAAAIVATGAPAAASVGDVPAAVPAVTGPPLTATYADLADLADTAPLVVRAQVRSLVQVEDARAPGLKAGRGRFLVKAATRSLITGTASLGPELGFLADLPLDPRGRPPVLKKREVLVFARLVPGRPAELALIAPDALLVWTPERDTQLRAVVTALLAPDAPAKVTGVREIINVPGNLVDESETQVFLVTQGGAAASLTIAHRTGQPARWGASFSELTADIGNPPQPGSLVWYRLACFLPNAVPAGANLSQDATARAQAERDYRMVLGELGPCTRDRG